MMWNEDKLRWMERGLRYYADNYKVVDLPREAAWHIRKLQFIILALVDNFAFLEPLVGTLEDVFDSEMMDTHKEPHTKIGQEW